MIITIENKKYDTRKMDRIMHELLMEADNIHLSATEDKEERTTPKSYVRRMDKELRTKFLPERIQVILDYRKTSNAVKTCTNFGISRQSLYRMQAGYFS